MYFRWGSLWTHGLCEVNVTSAQRLLRNAADQVYGYVVTWRLFGELLGLSTSLLSQYAAAMGLAYSQQPSFAGLYQSDGTTPTHLFLSGQNAIGGIRCTEFDFPVGDATEFVNKRTWSATVEAEYHSVVDLLMDFQESVAFQGDGGPRIVPIEFRDREPELQIVSQKTPIIVVQAGSALGLNSYPRPPQPLLPSVANGPEAAPSYGNPQRRGNRDVMWPVSWRYVMYLTKPQQNLRPNRWPVR